jgi:hypothetical protein
MIVKKEIRAYRDKNRGISISREGPGKWWSWIAQKVELEHLSWTEMYTKHYLQSALSHPVPLTCSRHFEERMPLDSQPPFRRLARRLARRWFIKSELV